MATMNKHAV